MQDGVPRLFRQIAPRRVGIIGQLLGELLEQGVVFDDEIFSADAPRFKRALAHALFRVGHEQLGHEAQLPPEPAARRARALGVIEREMARREFLEDVAAGLAGEVLAERQLAPRGVGRLLREDERAVAAFAKGQL